MTNKTPLLTDRFELEPLKKEHANKMFDLLQNKEIYQYIDDSPPSSLNNLKIKYKQRKKQISPDHKYIWLNWIIRCKKSAEYIGYIQATIPISEKTAILGYVIFPAYWRKGIATEAVSCIITELFKTYKVIEIKASIDKSNIASIALIKRLGFLKGNEECYCLRNNYKDKKD
ncbi:GNAT family N-acetyltransferase [Francisella sp. 19X1-34]|uniref:GNAT family N-acetyltransferase n=1 Tax=Francisella sp. 19X1-34 TaxID=3087177 RepID=UPI002E364CE5|nr:GNAT family N-acetyltransferase [Francisella sp. 19X1-34]MED7789280.1 GNAT family N-acetyltransferase [Francisella sp. 19X1-34]